MDVYVLIYGVSFGMSSIEGIFFNERTAVDAAFVLFMKHQKKSGGLWISTTKANLWRNNEEYITIEIHEVIK